MAVYKVPQDVEAEDKFVGPLTFKQFLFFGGAAITGYLIFLLFSRGLAFLGIVFIPIFIFFAVLAFPWNKDQSTEMWLAARIRFLFFPRKRIWNQSGIKELVTITVPKRDVHVYSDGLSQDQVKGRLSALASVIDSRGWALKNLPGGAPQTEISDRLVAEISTIPNENSTILDNANQALDEAYNPLANQFDTMIKQSESSHHKAMLNIVDEALHSKSDSTELDDKQSEDYWFLNQPDQPTDPNLASIKSSTVVRPGQTTPSETFVKGVEEDAFLEKVHERQAREAKASELGRIKTIQPLGKSKNSTPKTSFNDNTKSTHDDDDDTQLPTVVDDNAVQDSATQNTKATSTTPVDPGILALAHNDDLNVETIARQANKNQADGDEVIVNLH
jgi:hypothetical protein